jgi:phosphoribosylaminoimidazole-succinocarboxamide synthase
VEKGALLYEGKAKKLYTTDDENVLWVEYCDQATALNGLRKDHVEGKGELNNQISSLIFEKLNAAGVRTHFIKQISATEQLNEKVDIIPLEVVLRNVVAGSFAKRFGLDEGAVMPEPVVELFYKSDPLDDPFINDEDAKFLGIATDEELAQIKSETRKVNEILKGIWSQVGYTLVDFKLEFGRTKDGQIILADEISPDTSRLWDKNGNHMDKDVYRRNIGDIVETYTTVLDALKAL